MNWVLRSNGNYKLKQIPKTVQGMMDVNRNKISFNFLKSLDIAAINNETDLLHPHTHEFWENGEIKNYLLEF